MNRAFARLGRSWRWLTVSAAFAICVAFTAFFLSRGTSTRNEAGAAASASPAAPASSAASANSATAASPAVSGRRAASAHHGSTDTPEVIVATKHVPAALATALRNWDAGPGGSALLNVSDALGGATQAAGVRLYEPMRVACLSLASAVARAKAAPPIPDASMQRQYGLALATLAAAAVDCRTAISVHSNGDDDVKTHENPILLRQSVADLAAGAKDLYLATIDINAVRLHPPR